MSIFGIIGTILLCLPFFFMIFTTSCQKIFLGLEDPTRDDIHYFSKATEKNDANLCEKVSPQAYEGAAFNSPGYQVYYVRSNCYNSVAMNTGDANLCNKIKSLSLGWGITKQDGSKISKETCLASISIIKKGIEKQGAQYVGHNFN